MAAFIRNSKLPQCQLCLRRMMSVDTPELSSPFRMQLRGKKHIAKQPPMVKVKLLQNIRGYGREGSIIPVAPGRMRNVWYPQRKAEYMTDAQLKTLKDVVIERDFLFGMEESMVGRNISDRESGPAGNVQMDLLTPQRATRLLSAEVPEHLDFYRAPITTPEPERPRHEPPRNFRDSASAAAADLAAASEPLPKPQQVAIFGSVTTADIVASIKAVLSENEEAARVVLSAEDIRIVRDAETEAGADADRIKSLGAFEVDIRVKGGELVRRIVRVKAQE